MLNKRMLKLLSKKALPLVLILSILFSLAVPMELSVFSEEEETPQQSSDKICAFLYKINGSAKDLELVFQNSQIPNPSRAVAGGPYKNFASKEYHSKKYYIDGNSNPNWNWADQSYQTLPWYSDSNNSNYIKTITVKEEIKPLSIASWFYNCVNVNKVDGLENINMTNCENMSYAFYNFASNQNSLTSLNLSYFNSGSSSTGNVRQADFFIRSANIQTLNLAGMDLSGIGRVQQNVKKKNSDETQEYYISDLCYFIYACKKMTNVVLDGVNLSHLRQIKYFFHESLELTEIDLSNLASSPVDAYSIENFFGNAPNLKSVKLGSSEHPFGVATNLTANNILYAANSSLPADQIENYSSRQITLVYLGNMFYNCSQLESMDFQYFSTTDAVPVQCNGIFDSCSSLTSVNALGNMFNNQMGSSAWVLKRFFNGCSSLTEIDMSGNTRALTEGELIFSNCKSLKTLNLSGLGKNTPNWARSQNNQYRKLCATGNIYENCDELAEIVFSPYYPENIGSYGNIPPEKTWVKVENPSDADKVAYAANNGYSGTYSVAGDTNDTKTSAMLFGDFKPEYAGRWVAISRIVLDANGGTPDKQFLDNNAKDLPLNYDPSDIVTPQRTGYTFAGWYSKKDPDDPDSKELPAPHEDNAAAWTYYARWNENTYNLTVNGNGGGTVPAGITPQSLADHTGIDVSKIRIADDRTAIYFDNIRYTEYVELNKGYFTGTDANTILTSWGDRPNGLGREIGVNESVNKLSSEQNGSVTLYAQWHTPHAVITFNVKDTPEHPATPVSQISYDSADAEFGELPESSRDGYSFMYWYYTTEDPNTHAVTEHRVYPDTPVEMSRTLYAKWMENPRITFSCATNGGTFVDNSNVQTKICRYNRPIGLLPTPYNGKSAFKGWFENSDGTGDPITSETLAEGNKTYHAVWGYKLEVDANGGSFTDGFSGYPIQNEESMTVTLHTPVKPNATFGGWYTDTDYAEGHKVADGQVLDLSQTNKIYAKWIAEKSTVTLNPDGGTVSKNTIEVYTGHTLGELPTPVKDGYEFRGWYYEDTKYTAASVINSDITLKARWAEKNKEVTFKAEGGTFYDTNSSDDVVVKVAAGDTICCPPGVNRKDYDFVGWYTGVNGTGEKFSTATAINADTTYYAHWKDFSDSLIPYDNGKIEYFVKWVTPSDVNVTNNGDTLILHPTTSNTLNASLRIYFSTKEGIGKINKDEIVITIPGNKKLLKNRDGDPITCSTNLGGTNDTKNFSSDYFSCNIINGNYVFKNKVAIDTHTITYIDVDYSCNDSTKVAGGYIDENGDYQRLNDNNLTDFPVTIKLNNNELYNETLKLETHTKVDTEDILKTRSDVIYEWQDEWTDEARVTKPVDIENYFFIKWNLSANFPPTTSQAFSVMWSEDTVHDGTVVYTSGPVVTDNSLVQQNGNTSWSNELTKGKSPVAYVITMHRKDEARKNGSWVVIKNDVILNVKWRTSNKNVDPQYVQQYRKSVEIDAYIAPDENEGSRDFTKRIENYKNENSHYIYGGQELVQSGELSELNQRLIYNYDFREKNPFDESKLTWDPNTKVYTAPERTITLVDGERGQSDVRISPKKKSGVWSKWGADGEQNLTDADYSFDALVFNITEYDVIRLDGNTWSNPFEHTKRSEYGGTDIYVRYEGDLDFSFFKNVRITEQNQTVSLPNKVVGFKIVHKSSFAATDLLVSTKLKLKATDRLTDIVVNDMVNGYQTVIKNKARFSEAMDGATPFVIDTEDYKSILRDAFESSYILTETDSFIYANKSMGNGDKLEIDAEKATVSVPTAISGWGYNNSGYKKRLRKGVFRDLLPVGFSVDQDTIFVIPVKENYSQTALRYKYEDNGVQKELAVSGNNYDAVYTAASGAGEVFQQGYYSVAFENNINGTGRTMMVITVTVPDDIVATGISVFYKMKTTQSSIAANTTSPINYVSFKDLTENQSVPVDRSGKLSIIDDSRLSGCYSGYDDVFTAYASATTTLNKPPISTTAISSIVTADGSTLTKHEHVGLNMLYSYFINYSNDLNTQTKNLVFYDLLEKNDNSQWHGTLSSVDVTPILSVKNANNENATCKPDVYYSKKPKDQLSEPDLSLDNTEVWSSTPPEDLSQVTAIAVDCSKDTTGEAFVLDKSAYLGFYINMLSPMSGDENSMTYNTASIIGNYENVFNAAQLNMHTYNDVTLHLPRTTIEKTALPSSGTSVKPNKVVIGSTLQYIITVTNDDDIIPMLDVVVEDEFDAALVQLMPDKIKVIVDDGDEISVPSPVVPVRNITDRDGKKVFSATISSISPKQTIKLVIPVTVIAAEGTGITNSARITSINNITGFDPIVSDSATYHKASSVVAKILKVNESGEPLSGAKLMILDEEDKPITLNEDGTIVQGDPIPIAAGSESETTQYFVSTDQLRTFAVAPGKYKLVELATPNNEDYKIADTIEFTVDQEGFHHIGNKVVEKIEMTDKNVYNVIFHENRPDQEDEVYKRYGPAEIKDNGYKINSFTDPSSDDEYIFAGWYHAANHYESESPNTADAPNTDSMTEANFDNDSYQLRKDNEDNPEDYHLYAKWEKAVKIIYHWNTPGSDNKQKVYKTVGYTALDENGKITAFSNPELAGDEYEFAGWYHDADYTQVDDPNISADKSASFNDTYSNREDDYHLYAKWRKKDLKIIFHENAPETSAEQKQKVVKTVDFSELNGQNQIAPFSNPTSPVDGYVFDGWYYTDDYTVSNAPDSISNDNKASFDDYYSPNRDSDYHLYAKWKTGYSYKVIFHDNKPGGSDAEKQNEFKTFDQGGLITHFYDIPAWAGDEWVFAGWYHNDGYTIVTNPNSSPDDKLDGVASDSAAIFEDDQYEVRDSDYHLYAKWIPVGTVDRDGNDKNITDTYRGFGLKGVQIRIPNMTDSNFNGDVTPPGLRFVTSLSETLYNSIDALSDINVDVNNDDENKKEVPVEYGYVVGTYDNIGIFTNHYNLTGDALSNYKLQYLGKNVNGVDTTGETERSASTDYRYIKNVNCTSRLGQRVGENNYHSVANGVVKEDHRNFGEYRLYTLVVTYEARDGSDEMKSKNIDARSYIRYYDANRKLRVFYNNYVNNYFGGCMCNYEQIGKTATSPEVLPPLKPNATNP